MWPTLLTILALSVTISQGHDGLHDQNIVKTITGQEINTNRVKRFVTGYFVPQNNTNTPRWGNGTYGYNRNSTQQYVNPVQNYNFSKPRYQPYYPNPPGYTQYPANYSVHPAPNPQPNNNKPINPAYPGYPQKPTNYSGYPFQNSQQSNIKPLVPTQPGYSQYPSNYSGYPLPPSNKPFNSTQYPGNYSGYPAPARPPTNNIPKPSASWPRPAKNNSTAYPVSNTTKPGYANRKKNMCGRNDAMHTDACVVTVGDENCPEGKTRFGDYCVNDTDE
ncbi:hypothetical protein HF086_004529 [Spodoptera exigua]|uniref:Uncharacterized protein n=1 Tax=Spodoptera exigua TaxID=7107 RepID=A0A922M960_SPOEX|nr:hypothetical protein HF086_004529 [Spodoptera exigua]